jgi:hypothetical protein
MGLFRPASEGSSTRAKFDSPPGELMLLRSVCFETAKNTFWFTGIEWISFIKAFLRSDTGPLLQLRRLNFLMPFFNFYKLTYILTKSVLFVI